MADLMAPNGLPPSLYGMGVVVDRNITATSWIFPKHRFFEWEPEDEPLCRKYGIGHEGPEKPAAYEINGTLFIHPDLMEELKRQCQRIFLMMYYRSIVNTSNASPTWT